MPLETAALQIAEPTKPLPPNTTIYEKKMTLFYNGIDVDLYVME